MFWFIQWVLLSFEKRKLCCRTRYNDILRTKDCDWAICYAVDVAITFFSGNWLSVRNTSSSEAKWRLAWFKSATYQRLCQKTSLCALFQINSYISQRWAIKTVMESPKDNPSGLSSISLKMVSSTRTYTARTSIMIQIFPQISFRFREKVG